MTTVAGIMSWLGLVVAIVFVDLVLSGDNVLVIGAAAAKLHGRQRRLALTIGGSVAAVMRIALTVAASFILQFPFLNIIGGIAVIVIAGYLVRDVFADDDSNGQITGSGRFWAATLAVLIADLSMSLDNILAIAALAHSNYVLIIGGLVLSVLLLFVASAGIAHVMEQHPWLLIFASGILIWTGGQMFASDKSLVTIIKQIQPNIPIAVSIMLPAILVTLFALVMGGWWLTHRASMRAHS